MLFRHLVQQHSAPDHMSHVGNGLELNDDDVHQVLQRVARPKVLPFEDEEDPSLSLSNKSQPDGY